MRGLFVDRDGVINENRSDYVRRLDQFRFLPGVLDALADVARSPFTIVVVTNQAAVGRGYMTRQALDGIHHWMLEQVGAHGGRIDEVYVCPHRPDDGCTCRKPRPGLLRDAARDFNLSLEHSYFIGDATSDVQAAIAAGCRPILVLSGHGRDSRDDLTRRGVSPSAYDVVPDLLAAVQIVARTVLANRDGLSTWSGDRLAERLVEPVAMASSVAPRTR